MAKKMRYRLHWAGQDSPKPSIKWVVYDWQKPFCIVAYCERRDIGRKICNLLNECSNAE